jgi:hypothetical protein
MFSSKLINETNQKCKSASSSYKELLLEAAGDIFTQMVLTFNILLAGIIRPSELLYFNFGSAAYIDANMLEIPSLIEKKLRLLTKTGISEESLSKAFIGLIRFALSRNSHIAITGKTREL